MQKHFYTNLKYSPISLSEVEVGKMCLTLVCRLLLVLAVTGALPLLLTGFSTTGTGSGSGAAISSENTGNENKTVKHGDISSVFLAFNHKPVTRSRFTK